MELCQLAENRWLFDVTIHDTTVNVRQASLDDDLASKRAIGEPHPKFELQKIPLFKKNTFFWSKFSSAKYHCCRYQYRHIKVHDK